MRIALGEVLLNLVLVGHAETVAENAMHNLNDTADHCQYLPKKVLIG